ncbi:MAG: VWA domain-containing protein [Akkermansiaceae bacterium]|jgi:hypothetical protein|nr:VWA domain-containing protein [Akkermansiaceae bacterium]
MSFLSPLLLAFGAALAVPLWLHLRRRRRQAPVEFPSLRHLRAAAARLRRQARVEDVALLLLRLLLVALLVAAFARPVVRSGSGWWGAGRSVESLVVIDATASMAWRGPAGTRLDAAKRLAREWAGQLARSDGLALWVLTDRLERPVPVPVADRAHWFRQLDALEPSEGACGLASVFAAAAEWARSGGLGRKEIVLITDNQPAAWDWPAADFFKNAWPRGLASLVVLAPDELAPDNLSIASVKWHQTAVREGELLSGVAKVANHGGTAATDLVECRVGGRVLARVPVEVPAEGTLEVPLAVAAPQADGPVLAGEVALAGDALGVDDRFFFALPARRPGRSLVVEPAGEVGGAMRAGFFLVRALAAGGAGTAAAIPHEEWPARPVAEVDAVWFTGAAVTGPAEWDKALAFADGGGTVVVTATNQPEPLPSGWPVTVGPERTLPATRIATRLLAPAHPLFAGLWSERVPFPPLSQRVARECQPAAGARVLATLAGELPLLVEWPRGRGRVLWVNASADRAWGDLPLSPVFVPLMQQLARAGDLQRNTAATAWVGEAFPPLTNLPDAAWPAPRVTASGLHDATTAAGDTVWRCAANTRREESDLRPVPAEVLAGMLPGRLVAGTEGVRAWREETRREVPVWPWLLGAAAVVFALEGWLSARAGQRRIAAAGFDIPPSRKARSA